MLVAGASIGRHFLSYWRAMVSWCASFFSMFQKRNKSAGFWSESTTGRRIGSSPPMTRPSATFGDDYMKAYEEMIQQTATKKAPWYVVPADNKWSTQRL